MEIPHWWYNWLEYITQKSGFLRWSSVKPSFGRQAKWSYGQARRLIVLTINQISIKIYILRIWSHFSLYPIDSYHRTGYPNSLPFFIFLAVKVVPTPQEFRGIKRVSFLGWRVKFFVGLYNKFTKSNRRLGGRLGATVTYWKINKRYLNTPVIRS